MHIYLLAYGNSIQLFMTKNPLKTDLGGSIAVIENKVMHLMNRMRLNLFNTFIDVTKQRTFNMKRFFCLPDLSLVVAIIGPSKFGNASLSPKRDQRHT